jgi:hypothetical protein
LVSGSQAVEKRRFDAGVRPFRDAKAKASVLADFDQDGAQVDVAQVQRQRVSGVRVHTFPACNVVEQ